MVNTVMTQREQQNSLFSLKVGRLAEGVHMPSAEAEKRKRKKPRRERQRPIFEKKRKEKEKSTYVARKNRVCVLFSCNH